MFSIKLDETKLQRTVQFSDDQSIHIVRKISMTHLKAAHISGITGIFETILIAFHKEFDEKSKIKVTINKMKKGNQYSLSSFSFNA